MEKVDEAVEELKTMAGAGDPLWVRSVETGREILNYDEYLKTFRFNNNNSNTRNCLKTHIEASRETALVFMEPSRLVQSFMDEVINYHFSTLKCLRLFDKYFVFFFFKLCLFSYNFGFRINI